MTGSINLHEVAKIDTSEREELPCGLVTRTITVTDENGGTVQIHLYGQDVDSLTIRGDTL